jgi:hypothetical protein
MVGTSLASTPASCALRIRRSIPPARVLGRDATNSNDDGVAIGLSALRPCSIRPGATWMILPATSAADSLFVAWILRPREPSSVMMDQIRRPTWKPRAFEVRPILTLINPLLINRLRACGSVTMLAAGI